MTEVMLGLISPLVGAIISFVIVEAIYRAGILLVDFVTGGTYE